MNISYLNRSYKELFRLDKSKYNIEYHFLNGKPRVIVNPYGSFLMHITNGNAYLFDKRGNELLEIKFKFPSYFSNFNQFEIGYLTEVKMFFINNLLIDENLKIHELPFQVDENTAKYELTPQLNYPIKYDAIENKYYLYYQCGYIAEIWIYRSDFTFDSKIVINSPDPKKIKTSRYLLTINLDKREFLTYSSDHLIQTFDLKGNLIKSIENKNINTGSNKLSNNSKYTCFFFQGTKSHLIDIENGTSQVLWAHEAFEKGYYEAFYANMVHDFSVHRVYFSPKDNYIVAGAMFDKHVAWTIPQYERIELIPNEEYLKKLDNVFFKQLNGRDFFINHGRYFLEDVQFHENGKFFSLHINNDTLFWDDKFLHLGTILNNPKMKFLNDNYLICIDNTNIIFYEKEIFRPCWYAN